MLDQIRDWEKKIKLFKSMRNAIQDLSLVNMIIKNNKS